MRTYLYIFIYLFTFIFDPSSFSALVRVSRALTKTFGYIGLPRGKKKKVRFCAFVLFHSFVFSVPLASSLSLGRHLARHLTRRLSRSLVSFARSHWKVLPSPSRRDLADALLGSFGASNVFYSLRRVRFNGQTRPSHFSRKRSSAKEKKERLGAADVRRFTSFSVLKKKFDSNR